MENLFYYRHEDADRTTLKTVKSKNADHRDAGYLIQALNDWNRGNESGAQEAIAAWAGANQ